MITTAITSALQMLGIAAVITFLVAGLIKVVFLGVRFLGQRTRKWRPVAPATAGPPP